MIAVFVSDQDRIEPVVCDADRGETSNDLTSAQSRINQYVRRFGRYQHCVTGRAAA
jgi:hypothetical protein